MLYTFCELKDFICICENLQKIEMGEVSQPLST